MRVRSALLLMAYMAVSSCSDATTPAPAPAPGVPPASLGLRDIVVSSLPSPYYHFEYDAAGRIRGVSFASGFTNYEVVYDGDRISELRNNILVNRDRLEYSYDDAGRVGTVRYVDPDGVVFTRVTLAYDGPKLMRLQRERLLGDVFVVEKTLSFSYHADGNVFEITDHRPPIEGQQEGSTSTERYEEYDEGINVDGFGLIHDDFFDHLVFLPGVQLQKGNPAKVTILGDGTNLSAEYTYTYDSRNRPLTRVGVLTLLNGPNAGRSFPSLSQFSYY